MAVVKNLCSPSISLAFSDLYPLNPFGFLFPKCRCCPSICSWLLSFSHTVFLANHILRGSTFRSYLCRKSLTHIPNSLYIALCLDIPLAPPSQIFFKTAFIDFPQTCSLFMFSDFLAWILSCLHIWGQHYLFYLYHVAHNCYLFSNTATTLLLMSSMSLAREGSLSDQPSCLAFSKLILHSLIRPIFLKRRSGRS